VKYLGANRLPITNIMGPICAICVDIVIREGNFHSDKFLKNENKIGKEEKNSPTKLDMNIYVRAILAPIIKLSLIEIKN
jgi:hypothetical protein